MRKALLGLAVVVMVAAAVPAAASDVTGRWDCKVELDTGSGTPTFVFEQEGETLTGTYSGAAGEAKLTGTVKGDQIEFTIDTQYGKITYQGHIEDADNMKGTANYGGQSSGPWTAKRAM